MLKRKLDNIKAKILLEYFTDQNRQWPNDQHIILPSNYPSHVIWQAAAYMYFSSINFIKPTVAAITHQYHCLNQFDFQDIFLTEIQERITVHIHICSNTLLHKFIWLLWSYLSLSNDPILAAGNPHSWHPILDHYFKVYTLGFCSVYFCTQKCETEKAYGWSKQRQMCSHTLEWLHRINIYHNF